METINTILRFLFVIVVLLLVSLLIWWFAPNFTRKMWETALKGKDKAKSLTGSAKSKALDKSAPARAQIASKTKDANKAVGGYAARLQAKRNAYHAGRAKSAKK